MLSHTARFFVVVLATTLVPSFASAQSSAWDSPVVDVAKATRLEADARTRMIDLTDLKGAAKRLREAARLRAPTDPVGVSDLSTAARLSFYAKDLSGARTTMLEAAERALRMGDVVHAANFFVDVAHVSVGLQDGPGAIRALERARLLLASPMLSPVEQARLASRLGPAPTVVAAGRDDTRRR